MKKLLTSLVILTFLICAFSVVSFATDATDAVFKVEYADGGETVYCANATELNAAISTTTETTITMLKNYTETSTRISFPASSYEAALDLGGHTFTYEKSQADPAIRFSGNEATVKNGTIVFNNTTETYATAERSILGFGSGTGYTVNLENLTLTGESPNCNEAIRGIWAGAKAVGVTVNMTDVTIDVSGNIFLGSGDTFNIYSGEYISSASKMVDGSSSNLQYTNINIYGGTFSTSWEDITFKSTTHATIADDCEEVKNEDGTYSVVKKPVTVADTISASYEDGNGTKTQRFFADVATLDVAEAGFEVTALVEGTEYVWEIALNEVYSQVKANDVTYNATNYILTGAIGEVPTSFDGEFTVKVYTKNYEGVKSYID